MRSYMFLRAMFEAAAMPQTHPTLTHFRPTKVSIQSLASTAVPNEGCGEDGTRRMLCWPTKNYEQDTWFDRSDTADPVAYTTLFYNRPGMALLIGPRTEELAVPRAIFERVWALAKARYAPEIDMHNLLVRELLEEA